MLQQLLIDRFKLKVHREPRERDVYELLVAKNGPKLKPSLPDASTTKSVHFLGRNYEIAIPKAAMGDLADALMSVGGGTDRPVLDKTGLTGNYDLKATFTPLNDTSRNADPNDISIFAAVQALGLRLEARKAMVEVVVVDHIEKPSEN
jgi:uncharacterized protein (TIGR03435 family)